MSVSQRQDSGSDSAYLDGDQPLLHSEINDLLGTKQDIDDITGDTSRSGTAGPLQAIDLKHSRSIHGISVQHELNSDDEAVPTPPEKIQAYALLDFDNFTFYVQTMQILLGRMVEGDKITESLDIHLGPQKAISRRHAKIFYNFGHQRFELSIIGRNGAFVDDNFVETGVTLPLKNNTRIQIGETRFRFILPAEDAKLPSADTAGNAKPISPGDAVNLKTVFHNTSTQTSASREGSPGDRSSPRKPSLTENESSKQYVSSMQATPYNPHTQSVPKLDKEFIDQLRANAEASVIRKEEARIAAAGTNGELTYQSGSQEAVQPPPQTQRAQNAAKKDRKHRQKKVYLPEEIPEQYRSKPGYSYSQMIAECLHAKGTDRGMSLSEIYKGIQELYPYYQYCPDGWQSSVRHNLSMNKSFRKVSKEGKGWLWGLDEDVESKRQRQQRPVHTEKPASSPMTPSSKITGDDMTALMPLQKELRKLTADRKYPDERTKTQILTQALAMTIAQVNQAAKSVHFKGSPLLNLIEKNPSHMTKILSAALNAATKQYEQRNGKKDKPKPEKPESSPVPEAAETSPVEPIVVDAEPQIKPLAPATITTPKVVEEVHSHGSGIKKPQYYGKAAAPSVYHQDAETDSEVEGRGEKRSTEDHEDAPESKAAKKAYV